MGRLDGERMMDFRIFVVNPDSGDPTHVLQFIKETNQFILDQLGYPSRLPEQIAVERMEGAHNLGGPALRTMFRLTDNDIGIFFVRGKGRTAVGGTEVKYAVIGDWALDAFKHKLDRIPHQLAHLRSRNAQVGTTIHEILHTVAVGEHGKDGSNGLLMSDPWLYPKVDFPPLTAGSVLVNHAGAKKPTREDIAEAKAAAFYDLYNQQAENNARLLKSLTDYKRLNPIQRLFTPPPEV